MKKQFFVIAACILLANCKTKRQEKTLITASTQKVLVVHIEDYSQSVMGTQFTDSAAIEQLIYRLSHYETTIKLLGIYANSTRQKAFTLHVVQYPDTTTPQEANVYKRARLASEKKKAYALYEDNIKQQIADYTKTAIKPRTEPFSDVIHATELAQGILNSPLYQDCKRYLLFCSDGIQDEPGKRHVPLHPISIPNTTVIAVRSSLTEEQLKSLFPESRVIPCVDISDAIEMIK